MAELGKLGELLVFGRRNDGSRRRGGGGFPPSWEGPGKGFNTPSSGAADLMATPAFHRPVGTPLGALGDPLGIPW